MLDFQLDIEIHNEISNESEVLKSHEIKRKSNLPLFLPFTEKGIEKISWKDEVQNKTFIEKYDHGLLIDFPQKPYIKPSDTAFLNSGIRLSDTPDGFFEYRSCNQYYNFPSSYLELDVAREKIIRFKKYYFKKKEALELLAVQANDLIDFIKENKAKLPLSTLDNIYRFFNQNELRKKEQSALKEKLFYLSISVNSDQNVSISLEHPSNNSLRWVNFDANAMFQLLIKCLKLFFNELRQQHKGSSRRFEETYQRFDGVIQRFEIEFSEHFGNKFTQIFETEFSEIFETEFSENFETVLSQRLEVFSHKFTKSSQIFEMDFSEIFETELSRRFEMNFSERLAEFSEIFETESRRLEMNFSERIADFSQKFENTLFHGFKNEFSQLFETESSQRFENHYQGLLLKLVISSFWINRRNGRMFSFFDLYLRLYYFYIIISNNISIEQADEFELKF
jgi:hypothetical protein